MLPTYLSSILSSCDAFALRVYSGPKIGEPRVNDESTRDFDGGRALEDIVQEGEDQPRN